jgi:CHAT domain-containing protein
MGGEGLVGLAQAFQVAGARSVLASLWPIADRPTARLMRLFYAELRAGRTKDEALRQAQLALLRDPVTSHPANWAGLLLIGDYL